LGSDARAVMGSRVFVGQLATSQAPFESRDNALFLFYFPKTNETIQVTQCT
jgi:hypothetical protein